MQAEHWWCRDGPELLRELGSSQQGLSADAAASRLAQGGPNRLAPPAPRRLLTEIGRRLRNPLLLVLLAAGAASIVTGEGTSAWIIGVVVLLSLVLDHSQQSRADAAARRLSESIALRTRVLRGGEELMVDVASLVPGDVVRLAAGAMVPADGLLLAAQDFFVQQSALTGESFPVEKKPAAVQPDCAMEDAGGAVFMGSSVLSGVATMLVCRTGALTQMAGISHLVERDRGELAFENDLRGFGNLVLRITLFLVLVVVLMGGLAHRPWLETFLFAVALAVGLTPELLPMVVTVSLSRGALRLAQAGVIVRRLSAVHNLGSMDVLCTDKTGTLTEARIRLVRHVDSQGRECAAVLENAFLNSHFESGLRTPLEDAVLEFGGVDPAPWRKIDEVPFDFERRRLSVLVERDGKRRLTVKGAPADVLSHCDRWLDGDSERAWSPEARERAQATVEALENDGFRVLGVAYKAVAPTHDDAQLKDESELVFAGFAAFLDPPKADAADAVRRLLAAGIKVKVVTGDSDRVTRHVCAALGMRVEGVLLGHEIAAMEDRALAHRVQKTNLFCRVDPVQKNRVILALRTRGHVVGYMGDGVNDAPALHSADVGISVDGAADTARAAADLIMLRHSLSVLGDAVREGRRTFANTRKYILLGSSSNFGNMVSMAGAAMFLPFLPMLPVQILLNNLLYDTASAAIPLDRVEPAEIAAPQHWDMRLLRRSIFIFGPVSSLFDLLTFGLLLAVLSATPAQFQSGWFVESLATQVLAVFVIRTHGPFTVGHPHPALWAAATAVLAVAVALPFTPLAAVFGLVPLPLTFYAGLAGMTAAYLLTLEALKRRLFRRAKRRNGSWFGRNAPRARLVSGRTGLK